MRLAGEKVIPEVVSAPAASGRAVVSGRELGLGGSSDREILRAALRSSRVVITHHADVGCLAIRDGEPYLEIVHVRPGHATANFVLGIFSVVGDVEVARVPTSTMSW